MICDSTLYQIPIISTTENISHKTSVSKQSIKQLNNEKLEYFSIKLKYEPIHMWSYSSVKRCQDHFVVKEHYLQEMMLGKVNNFESLCCKT